MPYGALIGHVLQSLCDFFYVFCCCCGKSMRFCQLEVCCLLLSLLIDSNKLSVRRDVVESDVEWNS